MSPISLGSAVDRQARLHTFEKVKQEAVDGFGTRAIHVGSDPDGSTGAIIPAISMSSTFKLEGIGKHKVRNER